MTAHQGPAHIMPSFHDVDPAGPRDSKPPDDKMDLDDQITHSTPDVPQQTTQHGDLKANDDAGSTPNSDNSPTVSDRMELIERIKRGESPTWAPQGTVSAVR